MKTRKEDKVECGIEITKGIPIVTTETIANYKVVEVKGLVWASAVKSKSALKEIMAMARMFWGGDVTEYWELVNEARHEIIKKLNKNAQEIGANAIVRVYIYTEQIVPGTVEIMAYGTAVVIEHEN